MFTVGGGEYLVNVFNAVASWSGSGGYRGLIRVVMVMAFTWALLVTAFVREVLDTIEVPALRVELEAAVTESLEGAAQ